MSFPCVDGEVAAMGQTDENTTNNPGDGDVVARSTAQANSPEEQRPTAKTTEPTVKPHWSVVALAAKGYTPSAPINRGVAQMSAEVHGCSVCQRHFGTEEEKQKHEDLDVLYRQPVVTFNEELDEAYRQMACAAGPDSTAMDFDLTKTDSAVRMAQVEFDDVVVELALHNYETFHKMKRGTVSYSDVHLSSAGIQGWASTTFDDVNLSAGPKDENDAASQGEDRKQSARAPVARGDAEENQAVMLAIMESMLEAKGVRPPCRPDKVDQWSLNSSSNSGLSSCDEEEDLYQCEDDGDAGCEGSVPMETSDDPRGNGPDAHC